MGIIKYKFDRTDVSRKFLTCTSNADASGELYMYKDGMENTLGQLETCLKDKGRGMKPKVRGKNKKKYKIFDIHVIKNDVDLQFASITECANGNCEFQPY